MSVISQNISRKDIFLKNNYNIGATNLHFSSSHSRRAFHFAPSLYSEGGCSCFTQSLIHIIFNFNHFESLNHFNANNFQFQRHKMWRFFPTQSLGLIGVSWRSRWTTGSSLSCRRVNNEFINILLLYYNKGKTFLGRTHKYFSPCRLV